MLSCLFGPGLKSIQYLGSTRQKQLRLVWPDGRAALLNAGQSAWLPFNLTVTTTKQVKQLEADCGKIYYNFLAAVLPYLTGAAKEPPLKAEAWVEPELAALAARMSWLNHGPGDFPQRPAAGRPWLRRDGVRPGIPAAPAWAKSAHARARRPPESPSGLAACPRSLKLARERCSTWARLDNSSADAAICSAFSGVHLGDAVDLRQPLAHLGDALRLLVAGGGDLPDQIRHLGWRRRRWRRGASEVWEATLRAVRHLGIG